LIALREKARGASVLIAHGSTTLPAVAAATLGTSTPFVYRSVGDPLAWINTPARRARVRLAVGRASRVVALWRGSAVAWHEVLHVPAARITVIPNAVPASDFEPPSAEQRRAARAALGIGREERVAVCIGHLSPEKRIDLAIRAVTTAGDVTLMVAGDGPQMAKLQTLATALDAPVRFLGGVEHPRTVLAGGDALVVPSATEGQPAVAIEAGLSGLPVVATRVGGLPEVIEHGRTGLLVDPGDVDGLGGAIRAALDNGPDLGKAARAHCLARFDLAQVATRWQHLISAVLSPYPNCRWGPR
jgi:glycosyltransferase involved in cell wall biosynthesis